MASKSQTAKPVTEKEKTLIYCGPNLPKGILNRFTVYRGGIPKHIDPYLEECPAIKRLFVPVDDMSSFLTKAAEPGTSEYVWCNQVKSHFSGGVI